jgi:hypothetical protein
MSIILQRGDVIILAAPDFHPANTPADDNAYWNSVYEPFGVKVHHVSVMGGLTHPVVVAAIRNPPEVVMTPNASPL